MRIAAFPCPVPSCRLLSEVPPGGVRDFPRSTEVERTDPKDPESVRGVPEMTETVRGSPRTSDRKLKKRVTFSDPETPNSDRSSDPDTPRFRSAVSLMIGRIQHQQEVDIPDSALVLTTPEISTGSDVINQKRNRFFPSVTSVSQEEPDINGNHVTRTDSSAAENEVESNVRTWAIDNRFPVENDHPSVSDSIPLILWHVLFHLSSILQAIVIVPETHSITSDCSKPLRF